MSRPKSIGYHLRPDSGPLKDLLAHAERLAVLDRALAGFLGDPLSLHCQLANISGTSVILHTDSPVWSARLRYQLPQILECLNQHYPEANLLRADVRVKLPERS